MDEKILVTGIGIVNPLAIGVDSFTEQLLSEKSAIQPLNGLDLSHLGIQMGGMIPAFQPSQYFDKRLLVKTARFTNFALVSMKLAIEDAKLNLEQEDKSRMGIWFGNNAGGWDLCHQGFYELYTQGSQMVNPWQATGWFPTAAQGFVSIRFGITGLSKSFVADRASGASALYFALQALKADRIDTAFVGGCEAPFTRFGLLCYHETGQMSTEEHSIFPYRPFDPLSSGIVLGEGGVVLVLEKESNARKRRAQIYGEIASSAMTTDGKPNENLMLLKAMEQALVKSKISPK
ncbi:MAG TPA: beta-ketoacyl synthase N-terminal-like domain-containing protein, partial [Chlamydiales bacterium]|nr:beta-ketoacyl synthase N-terminal-like domain-containing protein [Chlamydiales bacterium]